jgi:hypothetical protein
MHSQVSWRSHDTGAWYLAGPPPAGKKEYLNGSPGPGARPGSPRGPDLRKLLVENYEKLDAETRALVPLKRLYWPLS